MKWIQRLRLFVQLDRIERKCDQILVNLAREENMLMGLIDDVLLDVQDLPTVEASVEQLLTNINAQLQAALTSGDPAKLQQIKDAIDAHKAKIAADVAANTPAAPTP